jgi:hypothetical protein
MNDRIRELAIQSGLPTALDYHQKRYEKFAELIVQETVLEVWIQLFNHGIDLSENTLFLEAMKKTKEKFGVDQ